MLLLKQSTAATETIGPILDSAGAEYTGAVIGDLSISKNGTEAAMAAAATLTHVSNGHYTLVMTTGNTDTAGRLTIRCNKSTYQMPMVEREVLVATVFDALVTNATTAAGGLGDIQRMAGMALTARDIGASVLLSAGTGTGQIALTSGKVSPAANSIDSTAIASGAITNAKFGTTPGSAGGLMIAGSNAATTFATLDVTGAFTVSDGVIIAAATSNRTAFTATGNGSGAGMLLKSGTSSADAALICQAQGTNDSAIRLIAAGTRHGIYATGGDTGHGVYLTGGSTSGDGARLEATASGHGLNAIGLGSGKYDINAGSLGASYIAFAVSGNDLYTTIIAHGGHR